MGVFTMGRCYCRIEIDTNSGMLTLKNNQIDNYRADITVNQPFTSDGERQTTVVTLGNLTTSHLHAIANGNRARIYAGFFQRGGTSQRVEGLLFSGHVGSIDPVVYDNLGTSVNLNLVDMPDYENDKVIEVKESQRVRIAASEKTMKSHISAYNAMLNGQLNKWTLSHKNASSQAFKIKEAEINKEKRNYANKLKLAFEREKKSLEYYPKYKAITNTVNLSFKSGTRGSSIIRKVAKAAGIEIKGMNLIYDKTYTSGYTAKNKPYDAIKEVATACKTPVYTSHGYLYVRPLDDGAQSNLYLQTETGMISEPERSDDKSSDSDNSSSDDTVTANVTQYTVTMLLRYDISTGTVFHIKSKTVTGWVVVISGAHDIPAFTTQVTFQLLAEYQKALGEEVQKAASTNAKDIAKAKAKALKARQAALRKQAAEIRRKKRQAAKKK